MFLGGRYPASCEAVSAARLLKIDATSLRRAVLTEPQLAFDMLAAASLRLRQLVDEIEQLEARSAPQRIADFFVRQAGFGFRLRLDRPALREGADREPPRNRRAFCARSAGLVPRRHGRTR